MDAVRILIVPQGIWPQTGGAEVHAWRVATALARRGHDVHLLATNVDEVLTDPKKRVRPPKGLPEHQTVEGVAIHRLAHDSFYGRVYRSPLAGILPRRRAWKKGAKRRAMRGYREAIREFVRIERPDAVLTMAHQRASVVATFGVRCELEFPLVYVPLTHWLDVEVWEPRSIHLAQVADAIVANTHAERDFLTREYSIEPERIVVGGLGARLPAPAPRERLGGDVLYMGRIDPGKRIDLLLAAMRHVWAQLPERRLILAGARWPGTQLVDEALKQLHAEDRARIDVIEDFTDADAASLFDRAGCLALASISESFGLVVLEAWMHGVPVVVQDMPLFREIVGAEGGWLAAFGSPAAMGAAICEALRDPDEALRRGRAGRERALERYDWDEVAVRYEEACRYAAGHLRPDVRQRLPRL